MERTLLGEEEFRDSWTAAFELSRWHDTIGEKRRNCWKEAGLEGLFDGARARCRGYNMV